MRNRILLAATVAGALTAGPAAAVDGVVLIDQNRAIAGAVTPGDAAGFPISINQPGSYRLSGNLTVPAGLNGFEINVDGVTLDLNGFSITGPGVFPNGSFGAVMATNRQRISVGNGHVAGFVQALSFIGDSRLIRLERLQINALTRSASGSTIGGLAAIIGVNRSSYALVNEVQAVGQVQITCPAVIRNSAVLAVETNVPPDGTGFNFPTNCRADNHVPAPYN